MIHQTDKISIQRFHDPIKQTQVKAPIRGKGKSAQPIRRNEKGKEQEIIEE
jgi:hypothetical protein